MRKAKLIKQRDIIKKQKRETLAAGSKLMPKNAADVVREWIDQHQHKRQSAHQAFAALFAKPQIRQTA